MGVRHALCQLCHSPRPLFPYSCLPLILALQSRGSCFHRSEQRPSQCEITLVGNKSQTPEGSQEKARPTPGLEMPMHASQRHPGTTLHTEVHNRGALTSPNQVSHPEHSAVLALTQLKGRFAEMGRQNPALSTQLLRDGCRQPG